MWYTQLIYGLGKLSSASKVCPRLTSLYTTSFDLLLGQLQASARHVAAWLSGNALVSINVHCVHEKKL